MKNEVAAVLSRKGTDVVEVVPGTSVHDAVGVMNAEGIGAVLVVVSGALVGIFTERDVLRRVVAAGKDPQSLAASDEETETFRWAVDGRFRIDQADRRARGVLQLPQCGRQLRIRTTQQAGRGVRRRSQDHGVGLEIASSRNRQPPAGATRASAARSR